MATYNSGLLVNKLTSVDQAMFDVFHNKLTVYPLDARGRERTVPARIIGLDEEFQDTVYPLWAILPLDCNFDVRRYSEGRKITSVSPSSFGVRITSPAQPYLVPYIVYGYCQDNRVLREMQMFAAVSLPRNSFLTENGCNHYVDLVSGVTSMDFEGKEFVLQITYNVWVEIDSDVFTDVGKVFNEVVIGYTVGVGRGNKQPLTVQTGVSGIWGLVGDKQVIGLSGISGISGYPSV